MEEQQKSRLGPTLNNEKIEELFRQLDSNKDGRVDVKELTEGLGKLGVPTIPGQAQAILTLGDKDLDGRMDLNEFVQFVTEQERKLWEVFSSLDTNGDGELDLQEIKQSLINLGIKANEKEIRRLLQRVDSDGDGKVSWEEWRKFLLLQPHTSVESIFQFWRHATAMDIGEVDTIAIPEEFSEEEKKTGMWWRQLLAGGGAGAVSRTCTAPLDRLKIFFQVHSMKTGGERMTVMSGFRHMLKEGGVRSLWRGNGVNVLKIAPESAIRFYAYEYFKQFFATEDKPLSVYQRLAAGGSAGVVAQTSIYPMEVMKTRLALATTGQYRGMMHCMSSVVKSEGPLALYKGMLPSLIGIIPYAGIDLAIYEALKNMWLKKEGMQDPGVLVPLACGALSSSCGQLASYPLSLVRTRLQAQTTRVGSNSEAVGMVGTLKLIIRSDGPLGLYRGLTPNFMKVAPAVSIAYVVYEQLKTLLGVKTVR